MKPDSGFREEFESSLKSISFYTWWNSNTCHFPPNIFSWSKGGDEASSLPLSISVYYEKMLGGKWHGYEFHQVKNEVDFKSIYHSKIF